MVGLWDLISLVRIMVREPQNAPKNQFAPKSNQLLKPREKPSEKPNEKLSGKPSEKPCEEPHHKPKPKPICLCCEFCGKDDHKREFCSKRKREARMAKEWANKDRYHPSHGMHEPRMPLPKGKGFVHKVLHGEIGALVAEVVVCRGRSDRHG
jgi:hypothetical protein